MLVLEVDDLDEDARRGWSVIAVGPARRLTAAEVHALPRASATGPRFAVLRIRPTRVEGRRLD